MKKIQIFLALIILGAATFAVIGKKETSPEHPKSERREVRENRRAERQAQMEQMIDSIMIAKAYVFVPQTAQQEPAGKMYMLSNPNFEIRIWDGSADIFLPYITGITPPYKHTLINYTLPSLNKYVAIQTDNGWTVTFESDLFSASTYNFELEVNAKFGTTTLTLSNTWNNDVTYTGIVQQIY